MKPIETLAVDESEPNEGEPVTHAVKGLEFDSMANVDKLERKELERLKTWLETSDTYQEYANQELRFDTLDALLAEYQNLTKDKTGKDVKKSVDDLGELLVDDVAGIKKEADEYYKIVLRQERHNQPMAHNHLEDWQWAEKREQLDRRRREIHNGLLTYLKSINRLCFEIIPKKLDVKLNAKALFSLADLTDENRTIAGEWAYDTALAERIKAQIEKINAKLEENK